MRVTFVFVSVVISLVERSCSLPLGGLGLLGNGAGAAGGANIVQNLEYLPAVGSLSEVAPGVTSVTSQLVDSSGPGSYSGRRPLGLPLNLGLLKRDVESANLGGIPVISSTPSLSTFPSTNFIHGFSNLPSMGSVPGFGNLQGSSSVLSPQALAKPLQKRYPSDGVESASGSSAFSSLPFASSMPSLSSIPGVNALPGLITSFPSLFQKRDTSDDSHANNSTFSSIPLLSSLPGLGSGSGTSATPSFGSLSSFPGFDSMSALPGLFKSFPSFLVKRDTSGGSASNNPALSLIPLLSSLPGLGSGSGMSAIPNFGSLSNIPGLGSLMNGALPVANSGSLI